MDDNQEYDSCVHWGLFIDPNPQPRIDAALNPVRETAFFDDLDWMDLDKEKRPYKSQYEASGIAWAPRYLLPRVSKSGEAQ